ncbi:NAD(P)-binding protein, partial [Halonatronum saccharophilum]
MKVAIIGGGISGLASALAFERYGITPVVFEKNGHIGDPVLFTSAILHIFNHFKSDPFKHLKKKYNLKLSPSSSIKRIAMYGPTEQVTIEGNLGYITNRMREGTSINNQLSSKLSLSVEFDSLVDIDDLKE